MRLSKLEKAILNHMALTYVHNNTRVNLFCHLKDLGFKVSIANVSAVLDKLIKKNIIRAKTYYILKGV